jgi:hypothetical protein
MWAIRKSSLSQILLHSKGMSHSLVDIGWIAPLYYTALKCRIHRVRLQAIRLLEEASHQEGIWDSKIAAGVARCVVEIEERGSYDHVNKVDDFLLSTSPEVSELSMPTLPESFRIREIQVIMPNGPDENVFMLYKLLESGDYWQKIQVFV